jgi:hypothetical protein
MGSGRPAFFGFFAELGFRVGAEVSAVDLPRGTSPDKAAVVSYLRSGSPLVVVPGILDDPLSDPGPSFPGGGSVLTDGEWLWPQVAAELVDLYDIAVPESLLMRMREAHFTLAPLPHGEILAVFGMVKDELSLRPINDQGTVPRIRVLDVRSGEASELVCVVRSDGGTVSLGQELRVAGDASAVRVQDIARGDVPLVRLDAGESAKITLTGPHAGLVRVGDVLYATED